MRARVIIAALFLTILHFLLHVGLGIGAGAPDLLTLALLIAAREMRVGWAALSGFFLGLLEDALSVLAFGASTVALTVVGVAGARTRDLFVGDSLFFVVTYFMVGKWARDLIRWVAVGEDLREPFVSALLVESSVQALYMAIVGLAVIAFFGISWEPSVAANPRMRR